MAMIEQAIVRTVVESASWWKRGMMAAGFLAGLAGYHFVGVRPAVTEAAKSGADTAKKAMFAQMHTERMRRDSMEHARDSISEAATIIRDSIANVKADSIIYLLRKLQPKPSSL